MKTMTTPVETANNIRSSTAKQMSVDMSGMAHIMDIMSNLYSNQFLAVLREYSVNALDAHREAGQTKPIEVTLPTAFDPVLIIKDYGLGMSEDEIYTIYAQYGASTKRADDTLTGGFGLGCKSAFAITQQFTVTAVKNGKKSVVLFAKDDNNIGTVDVLLRADVDEPNGVEVAIPVSNVNAMRNEAESFFSCWRAGEVIVHGCDITSIFDSADEIIKGIYLRERTNRYSLQNQSYVIMGNVPYLIDPNEIYEATQHRSTRTSRRFYDLPGLIFEVPVGTVNITPSREMLNYSKRTKQALKDLYDKFFDGISDQINERLKNADKPVEVFDIMNQWGKKDWVNIRTTHWRGRLINDKIHYPDGNRINQVTFGDGRRATAHHDMASLVMSPIPQTRLIVTGVTSERHVTTNIKDYLKSQGLSSEGVALFNSTDTYKSLWLQKGDDELFTYVTVEDIMEGAREHRRSVRRSRSTGTVSSGKAGTRGPLTYPVLCKVDGEVIGQTWTMQLIKEYKSDLYYHDDSVFNPLSDNLRNDTTFVSSLLPDNAALILVERNRSADALLRRAGRDIAEFTSLYERTLDTFFSNLGPAEKVALNRNQSVHTIVKMMNQLTPHRDKIVNKDFCSIVDAFSGDKAQDMTTLVTKFKKLADYSSLAGRKWKEKSDALNADALEHKYPLITMVHYHDKWSENHINHVISYVNAIA